MNLGFTSDYASGHLCSVPCLPFPMMITSCTNRTPLSLHVTCAGYLCGTSTLASTPHYILHKMVFAISLTDKHSNSCLFFFSSFRYQLIRVSFLYNALVILVIKYYHPPMNFFHCMSSLYVFSPINFFALKGLHRPSLPTNT